MSEQLALINRRRFPRAPLSCNVEYRDRLQAWQSQTRDISFGGCRLAGYYPFPLGKPLSLTMTHPSVPQSVTMTSKVARLCGGAENSVGLAFDKDWSVLSKFEQWIRSVAANDHNADRTLSQAPDHLPMEALLRRAPRPRADRWLTEAEITLMRRLDSSSRPVPLIALRTEWGAQWERKSQVVFDLIADGIILCSMVPGPRPLEEFAVERFFKTSNRLMKDLEGECGPLNRDFARELETMTREVIGTSPGSPHDRSSIASRGLKVPDANEETRRPIVPPYSGRTKPS